MNRYDLAKQFIKQASIILKHDIYSGNVEIKSGHQDLVTEMDKQIEMMFRRKIMKFFPDDSFVGEEFPPTNQSLNSWYIDPIDGTTNYLSLHRDYAISIGFRGESQNFGFVLDVVRDELYEAELGHGAFRNGKPLHVSTAKQFNEMVLFTPAVHHILLKDNPYRDVFCMLSNEIRGIRSKGSVALELCSVAAGEADLFACVHAGPWDYMAAQIILQEAGGELCDFNGKIPNLTGDTTIIAASKNTLPRFLEKLQNGELR